ncbi:MAG: threonine ammonia-lyase [Chloroflexi bacterium]|nr:threonine ammonia-lyase [Chloroflexota bacterium]
MRQRRGSAPLSLPTTDSMTTAPTIADVQAARVALRTTVYHTPLLRSQTFSRLAEAEVWFKPENLQRTGSFKLRGALYVIAHLDPELRARGVVAARAGNHAQGVALGGRAAGIAVTIVMPRTAPLPKLEATRGYGAEVILHGENYYEAFQYAERLSRAEGKTLIHAYDNRYVIAGQGTIALEVLDELPDVEVVVVPVGGGGLISGIGLVLKTLSPQVELIGVQAAAAPAALRSYRSGHLETVRPTPTLADGVAVSRPGHITLGMIRRYVDDMVAVTEDEIAHAMVLLAERAKLLVEGAGAVGAAALAAGRIARPGKRIAVVLSGGNVSLPVLARLIQHDQETNGATPA